jgi:uncharacterized protein YfaS (alpha-2-macroglobulin family)
MNFRDATRLLLSLFMFSALPIHAQEQARIESFSPQGAVKQVRQVRARFSEPMVAFGDPRAVPVLFDIVCPEKGTARWADERNWIFDFDRDLPAGVRCEFRLKEGLRTLAGKAIAGQQQYFFTTGGPAIISSEPYEGDRQIDEEQFFLLELDAEAEESSVAANAYFAVEGITERVGVRFVPDKEWEVTIKALYQYRKEKLKEALADKARFPLIKATRRFPEGSTVKLVWGRGVATRSGVRTEQDQTLAFVTRAPFTATFHCTRENAEAQCMPIAPMRVSFSSPVLATLVRKAVLKGPGGRQWTARVTEADEESDRHVSSITFQGPFPEKSSFTVELPPGVTDESGRKLTNADRFPMAVKTDEYPPLAKFAADFGIIELHADPMLPVTLRNVEPEVAARMFEVTGGEENLDPPKPLSPQQRIAGTVRGRILKIPADKVSQMMTWIEKVRERAYEDRGKSIFGPVTGEKAKKFSIPKLQGAKSFEVVGIPLKTPGFYVVEIESGLLGAALLGETKPMYVATTALVTNLSVHFKWGIDSSLVWVTTLDTAKPVGQAGVEVRDCTGKLIWKGKSDTSGIARPEDLPSRTSPPFCSGNPFSSGLIVSAQSSEDLAFVNSNWQDGIEPWRFKLPMEWQANLSIAHTVFDRTLFRAGETVHMKNFVRRHLTAGFALPQKGDLGNSAKIVHEGSGQEYEIPLQWDTNGIAETSWTIPREAKLGTYQVRVSSQGQRSRYQESGTFRVEEFRVPLMKGVIRPPSGALVAPTSVPLDLTVRYLAGGAAGSLPVRFRYILQPHDVSSISGFEQFSFSTGRVREGLVRGEAEATEQQPASELKSTDLTLDRTGSARTVVPNLPKTDRPQEILAELEYRDPNGEIQTVSSRLPLWPADRNVGIRPDSWTLSKEALRFQVAVVDLNGKPVAGAPVKVDLFQLKVYSHRKRLVGGFYAYEHFTETKRVKVLCEGKTDRRGLLLCEKPSPISGNVLLQATTRDGKGREVSTFQESWVAGDAEWWFKSGDADRIDLLPETHRYEPGAKARFQVRMPFRSATALITVEREGVGDALVKEISGKEPVIELPVKDSYAPNVFVSVFVVRGRVTDAQPTATVDLGRPAYKLGVAEISVGWKPHELKVKVTPDRTVYKVRDKAKVQISVTTADGKLPPGGSEVAVAAVDEGLLELMPNTSWQLLEAMMGRRSYGVQTSTAQMHVVGKRHFGLKALPQGGGGGRQITRELFDTLLFWKARVTLDANGAAAVEVPLNDSITGFRIVAVANGGVGLFGTGSASIRSSQDLILFSSLSPVVREGDRIHPEFTLRNATEAPMDLRVAAHIDPATEPLAPIALSLGAGESRLIGWDITVPVSVDSLRYEVEARGGEGIGDHLKVTQKVVPAVPVRTMQATLARVEKELRVEVERPKDAIAGRGELQVTLRPTLLDGLAGVTAYMSRYPYTCLEQIASKAVALRDKALWERMAAELPAYIDSEGLVKYFPSMRFGSDTLTSYVLAIGNEAGWEIPEASRLRMVEGLKGFVEGRVVRYSSLPTADLTLRKLSAIEALSRYSADLAAIPTKPASRSARAQPAPGSGKIDDALLSSIVIDPNLWPTSAVIDWLDILRRSPALRSRDQRLVEADQILRSRLNFQGTTMGFSTERSDSLYWLMVSVDTNAVRMLLSVTDLPAWAQDVPRLVRGALGRQFRGHWDTTVANAWGVLATEKFAKVFEKTPVTGTVNAALAGKQQALTWSASPAGKMLSFPWPDAKAALTVTNAGTGNPWATVQSLAAVPLREPFSSGFKIRKTLQPVEQKEKGSWSQGDIVRVKLDLESQSDMTWVVVNDPIPAGAAVFGTGLGRDSQLLTRGEEQKGWVWPAYEERSFEGYRVYYDYVPKGTWTVEYTMRLNAEGLLNLPVTRVEALYAPEMFGEIPNEAMRIK